MIKNYQGQGLLEKGLGGFFQGDSSDFLESTTTTGVIDMAFGLQAYKFKPLRIPNNINYQYFRPVVITTGAGTLPTGSTVDLIFNHAALVSAGESDVFGSDLRLTYAGTDQAEREIDLEIINPNTATAKLRFKTQKIILPSSIVDKYRLYSKLRDTDLFEETFRDKNGIYYFWANKLSPLVSLSNGNWDNTTIGFKRTTDGNQATLGFNVPNNADVEIEFRFLDDGANDQSKYIGLNWRGDGATARTFRLDNNTGVTDNQISNYFNGTVWTNLGSISNAKTEPHILRVKVVGTSVQLYIDNVLLTTVVDATADTGGMQLILPAGSEAAIYKIQVKTTETPLSAALGTQTNNIKNVSASTKVALSDTTAQNIQSTVIRLKKHPDNLLSLEEVRTIGEWGDSIPATAGQKDSLEIHLYQIGNKAFAAVQEFDT